MIGDVNIAKAVAGILQRSEKQQDLQKLVGTFVDVGILPQIDTTNNQIIYGRRGTGKTHILKVLASQLQQSRRNIVVYIDTRTLGSTNQFSDPSVPLPQRCLSLFRDIFIEIHDAFLNHVAYNPSENSEAAFALLIELSNTVLEPVRNYAAETIVNRELGKEGGNTAAGISLDAKIGPRLKLEGGSNSSTEKERTTSYQVRSEDKVIFPDLVYELRTFLEKADAYLYLLLDEWSSIPIEVQPYLAEFLRRGFLPCPHVSVKIASLEYRSNFGLRSDSGNIVGFELGADISTQLDIDDYYVFDRNKDRVIEAFSEMLYRHLSVDLPERYLRTTHNIRSGVELQSRLFTSKAVFEELVRAAEGVARDLINIFNRAFFDALRRKVNSIDKKAIYEAARQWFEQDKQKSLDLDPDLSRTLRTIVEEVIGHRRARSFLLSRELERHTKIQRLFDARVLHLVLRGYADKDNPGSRYNIYTLDYGTYVDLINTSKQPQIEFVEENTSTDGAENEDSLVPFDDKRSIRRIILTEQYLS